MKKIIIFSFILVALWFMTIGMKCEPRFVEVPVLGTGDQLIQVEEVVSSYNEQFEIGFYDILEKIAEDNSFIQVGAILLQGITYTIQDNESAAGTIINGTIDVSTEGYNSGMAPLIKMTNVNLAEKVGVINIPPLEVEGVTVINQEFSPIFHINEWNDFTLYFSLHGNSSPAPSAAHPLKFKIQIKIYVNMIGILEADVPTM